MGFLVTAAIRAVAVLPAVATIRAVALAANVWLIALTSCGGFSRVTSRRNASRGIKLVAKFRKSAST